MQKPNHAKTKWAPSLRYGLIALAVAAVLLPFVFQSHPTATLRHGSETYRLEIVSSEAAREQGLSGRASLAVDKGMLFVFPSDGAQCMWMKDMAFSIDIIWLDASKRVVHIEHAVAPETYPKEFCSATPARYVIELPSGQAKRAGIALGDVLDL